MDEQHRVVGHKLLRRFGYHTVDANTPEDRSSVADIWLQMPSGLWTSVGLKWRGENAQNDYNLTAWSAVKGDLPEFKNAGRKLYLYQMHGFHKLVVFPDQEIPSASGKEWSPITNGARSKPITKDAWVRLRSKGSNVQQGVIYVPQHMVEVLRTWDTDLNEIIPNCEFAS